MGPPPLGSRRWLMGLRAATTTVKSGEDAGGGGEGGPCPFWLEEGERCRRRRRGSCFSWEERMREEEA
jgi:hypothetical protein